MSLQIKMTSKDDSKASHFYDWTILNGDKAIAFQSINNINVEDKHKEIGVKEAKRLLKIEEPANNGDKGKIITEGLILRIKKKLI